MSAQRGRPPYPDILTPRQFEVLELVREGLSNGEIARRLGISADGAKFHVSEIITKLGVSTRREAAGSEASPRVLARPTARLRFGRPALRLNRCVRRGRYRQICLEHSLIPSHPFPLGKGPGVRSSGRTPECSSPRVTQPGMVICARAPATAHAAQEQAA